MIKIGQCHLSGGKRPHLNAFMVILLCNNVDLEQKLPEIKRSLTESEVKVHGGTPEAGLRHKTALQSCTSKPDYEASMESEQLTAYSLRRLIGISWLEY